MAQEILDVFYKSGLHGVLWPHETKCVCVYMYRHSGNMGVDIRNFENTAGKEHAEIYMLGFLKNLDELEEPVKPILVRLYINNTPCNGCSQQILSYLQTQPYVGMEIIFCQLYNIQRDSCLTRCRGRLCSRIGVTPNEAGLKDLWLNNVLMRPFSGEEDWQQLERILNHLYFPMPENQSFESKYQQSWNYGGEENSRAIEDNILKDDWIILTKKFRSAHTVVDTMTGHQVSPQTSVQIWDLYCRSAATYGAGWNPGQFCVLAYSPPTDSTNLAPFLFKNAAGQTWNATSDEIGNALDKLDKLVIPPGSHIVLFCIQSPDSTSHGKITDFMKKQGEKISMLTIRFVQLYGVKQAQSRVAEWLRSPATITDEVHNETLQALTTLYEYRTMNGSQKIIVKPFDMDCWGKFRQVFTNLPATFNATEVSNDLQVDWQSILKEIEQIQLATGLQQLNICQDSLSSVPSNK